MPPHALVQTVPQADLGLADDLFWLSKLDGNLPRAHFIPDFKRVPGPRHQYGSVPFTLDPGFVRVLKSLDSALGVSDVALCATVLGVLLAKYHLQDEMLVGLQATATRDGDGTVVPLRLACRRDAPVAAAMRAAVLELEDVQGRAPPPVARMAQMLGVETSDSRCPFFDVAFAVGAGEAVFDFGRYPVDVAFLFDVSAGEISGRIVYASDLFERVRVETIAAHFVNAADALCSSPHARIADIEILSSDERRRLLHEFSGRTRAFRSDTTLFAEFEAWVERRPDAVAVVHGDDSLSYAALNTRANRLAHTLLSLGLGRGQFVGILLHRSCDFVVAMLAVFKAGGAYVPLDPTYPLDRMRYMVEDSEAAFVISTEALLASFGEVVVGAPAVRVVLSVEGMVDQSTLWRAAHPLEVMGPAAIAAAPVDNPAVPIKGTDRAYMIYTSGSTGQPKGAICRHDGALNHLYGELEGLGISSPFRFLQTAASSSDISVWQFMAPLVFGGATVIADYAVVVDPVQLFRSLREGCVTVAELVPVVLRALVDHVCSLPESDRVLADLRFMMASGEALPAELVDRWLMLYPHIPIANTYGPTETSDDVTLIVLREPLSERRGTVPIGRPLPNAFLFILDAELRPVPIGVPGEICIAGIAVGEGYWRQPEKTQAAFVASPFPDVAGGLMYRSGDLGRWLPDGSVEFLGRIDQQVKVRGFRVEPGEVETVFTRHPGVQDAAVVAFRDTSGTNRLVAYYVNRAGQTVSPVELRQFVKATLADHMVPSVLVPLAKLPLTPLGKVDRKALSRLEFDGHAGRSDMVAPRNPLEQCIAAAWCAVLGRRAIGVHDNFFEVGGDSISIIHIVAELKKSGIALAPKQFFLHPTVAALATELGASTADRVLQAVPLQRADERWDVDAWRKPLEPLFRAIEDVFPLGATQRGIYLQTLLPARTSGAYIEQIAFVLNGNLDEETLARAWQYTINATPALRTAVVRRGVPLPMQVIVRTAASAPQTKDWREVPDQKAALETLIADDRRNGFDLKAPPLTRLTVVRLSDTRWHVLWTYHHIILDGWSEPLVLKTLFSAYDALIAHRIPQAEKAGRYRDFIAWCESQDHGAAQTFWRQQLSGFACPVSIKDDSPGVRPPGAADVSHDFCEIALGDDEARCLEDVARHDKLTLSTIVHGAWAMLLHRRTGSGDVVFGSVASGRQCGVPQAETMRGVLVTTQPVRSRLVSDASVSSWLRSLQLQMAEMREFEQTSLALIQQWSDVPVEKRPLFDTLVVLANYFGSDLAHIHPAGMELTDVSYYTQPLFALTLFVVGGGHPSVRVVYDKKRYAPDSVRVMLEEYRQLLRGIAEYPEQRLGSLLASR